MPELPEVNAYKVYFNEAAFNQKIERVIVHDDKIIRNMDGNTFAEACKNRTFVGSYRRGKYLFGEFDNGDHVLLHFGMTGDIKYYSAPEDKPKHERFVFVFENGMRLGFDDPRKFGRILYLTDLQAYIKEIKLGEDALVLSEDAFMRLIKGKKASIKGFLLNQKFLAGVGNLYADETCYQLQIHPATPSNQLTEEQQRAVFRKMQEIMGFAAEQLPNYKGYPPNWFWNLWREVGKEIEGKGTVVSCKVAGRTTMFVEGWQVLPT
ncbi:MAG: Fpg/Nei family DNA glycosylase [Saprospiraceae bacterium]